MHYQRSGTLCLASVALVALFASGCQGPALTSARPPVAPSEPTAPLTKAQGADVKIALAQSFEKSGDTDQAIALYTQAAGEDPKRADACLRLAALHEQAGNAKDAREWQDKAQARQPDNPDVYCNLGYSLYLQGNWAEATKQLKHALRLNPAHARAHNNLGLALARMGETDNALAEFKKAGCSPADAQINLGYCLLLEGRLPEARQCLETALKLEPESAAAKKALQEVNRLRAKERSANS